MGLKFAAGIFRSGSESSGTVFLDRQGNRRGRDSDVVDPEHEASTAITAGLLASAQLGVSLLKRELELTDIKRSGNREIAILYDIKQTFGEPN